MATTGLAHARGASRLAPLDPRSIGAFRIALGIGLVADLALTKFPYMRAFYTDAGMLPREALRRLSPTASCSLLSLSGGEAAAIALLSLTLAAGVLLALGVGGRFSALAAFVALSSIHERNAPFLYGADAIFRLSLFWSLFLPLGARFVAFAPRRARRLVAPVGGVVAVAILAQISLVYFMNAVTKTGETWRAGTAVAFAVSSFPNHGPWADGLLALPWLWAPLTYLTLAFEYGVALLLFSPLRNRVTRGAAAGMIVAFHWALLPFLNIGLFALATTPLALLVLPGEAWDRLGVAASSPHGATEGSRRPTAAASARLREFAAGSALVAILAIHLGNVWDPVGREIARIGRATCNCLELYHEMAMFAPDPRRLYGYTLAVAHTPEGRVFDVRSGREYARPEDFALPPLPETSIPFPIAVYDKGIDDRWDRRRRLERLLAEPGAATSVEIERARREHRALDAVLRMLGDARGRYELARWRARRPEAAVSRISFVRPNFYLEAPGRARPVEIHEIHDYRVPD